MNQIDRYMLSELWKRLALALTVVLVSLVIERVLRLFDLVSMKGGPLSMVWEMALMLIPHYLGLALPAGFFLSVFLVVARVTEDNEFDILLSSGVSPWRFSRAFMVSALLLVAVNVGVFGYAQPYGRYAYRAIHHLVDNVPWGARVPERSFAVLGKDTTLSADRVDSTGEGLDGVFVHTIVEGKDVTITARSGRVVFRPENASYRLLLFNGTQLTVQRDKPPTVLLFDELSLSQNFAARIMPFRPRGNDVRELSLTELRQEARSPTGKTEAAAELHARLVRSVSLLFIPLLAVPLALAAKRSRRSAGIVFGAFALVVYHYALQTVEGLAESEVLPPASLWIAMAAFAAMAMALFRRVQLQPAENPLDGIFARIDDAILWAASLRRRRKDTTQ